MRFSACESPYNGQYTGENRFQQYDETAEKIPKMYGKNGEIFEILTLSPNYWYLETRYEKSARV